MQVCCACDGRSAILRQAIARVRASRTAAAPRQCAIRQLRQALGTGNLAEDSVDEGAKDTTAEGRSTHSTPMGAIKEQSEERGQLG